MTRRADNKTSWTPSQAYIGYVLDSDKNALERLARQGVDQRLIQSYLDREAMTPPMGRLPSAEQLDRAYGGQRYDDTPAPSSERRRLPITINPPCPVSLTGSSAVACVEGQGANITHTRRAARQGT